MSLSSRKFSLASPGQQALPLNSHRRPHPTFYGSPFHLFLWDSVSITIRNAEKNIIIRTPSDLNLNPDSTTQYLYRTWGKFTFLSLGSLKSCDNPDQVRWFKVMHASVWHPRFPPHSTSLSCKLLEPRYLSISPIMPNSMPWESTENTCRLTWGLFTTSKFYRPNHQRNEKASWWKWKRRVKKLA